tara:strand:- start:129 stop:341 length:213 start_codon:yes stop_codon:yes gene_type:complete
MSNNERILRLVEERLEQGQEEYKQDVPLDGSRNHLQDTLEELIDSIVYLSAKVLELQESEKHSNLFGRDY